MGGPRHAPAGNAPSVRLVQILRTYCRNLAPDGVRDLRLSLVAGRYPWLHDDLTAALTTLGTSGWWAGAVGTPDARPHRRVLDEQRRLWRALFPDDPFPAAPRSRTRQV
ncbi:MAG TPA: hypothetical protein VGN37_19535 [Actinocatenispora sp.]